MISTLLLTAPPFSKSRRMHTTLPQCQLGHHRHLLHVEQLALMRDGEEPEEKQLDTAQSW